MAPVRRRLGGERSHFDAGGHTSFTCCGVFARRGVKCDGAAPYSGRVSSDITSAQQDAWLPCLCTEPPRKGRAHQRPACACAVQGKCASGDASPHCEVREAVHDSKPHIAAWRTAAAKLAPSRRRTRSVSQLDKGPQSSLDSPSISALQMASMPSVTSASSCKSVASATPAVVCAEPTRSDRARRRCKGGPGLPPRPPRLLVARSPPPPPLRDASPRKRSPSRPLRFSVEPDDASGGSTHRSAFSYAATTMTPPLSSSSTASTAARLRGGESVVRHMFVPARALTVSSGDAPATCDGLTPTPSGTPARRDSTCSVRLFESGGPEHSGALARWLSVGRRSLAGSPRSGGAPLPAHLSPLWRPSYDTSAPSTATYPSGPPSSTSCGTDTSDVRAALLGDPFAPPSAAAPSAHGWTLSTAASVPGCGASSSHVSLASNGLPPWAQSSLGTASTQSSPRRAPGDAPPSLQGESSAGRDSISLFTPDLAAAGQSFATFGNPLSRQGAGAALPAEGGAGVTAMHVLLEQFEDMVARMDMWRSVRRNERGDIELYSKGCAYALRCGDHGLM